MKNLMVVCCPVMYCAGLLVPPKNTVKSFTAWSALSKGAGVFKEWSVRYQPHFSWNGSYSMAVIEQPTFIKSSGI